MFLTVACSPSPPPPSCKRTEVLAPLQSNSGRKGPQEASGPTSSQSRVSFEVRPGCSRLCQDLVKTWSISKSSRNGDCTTSLYNLFHCLTSSSLTFQLMFLTPTTPHWEARLCLLDDLLRGIVGLLIGPSEAASSPG